MRRNWMAALATVAAVAAGSAAAPVAAGFTPDAWYGGPGWTAVTTVGWPSGARSMSGKAVLVGWTPDAWYARTPAAAGGAAGTSGGTTTPAGASTTAGGGGGGGSAAPGGGAGGSSVGTAASSGGATGMAGAAAQPPAGQGSSGGAASSGLAGDAAHVFVWTNQVRAQHGLAPLADDALLDRAALAKCQDMVDHQYFGDNSPTYGTAYQLQQAFGVHARIMGGQNVAGARTAWLAFNLIVDSPPHLANIFWPGITEVGDAVVPIGPNASYGVYVCQEFAGN